jgi:glycosyltransferase involved in cell wall biosynthesis
MSPLRSDDSLLRFCLVSTFYPPYNFGGDGIYAHRLANGLARRGHRVTVVHSPSAYEYLAGAAPAAGYADHPNVTVRALRTPLGRWGLLAVQQTGRAVLQAKALRRSLEDGAFDVIHYNNVSLLGGPAAFGYGRGLKLCTLIDHWLVCPMHALWKFDREVCTKPTCFRCTLAGGRPPQLWRSTGLMQKATRHIDAFLGPSLFTIRMHRERGIEGTMIQLPLFHAEPSTPAAYEGAVNSNRPYFLFAGRLEKIKGLQTVIPAFRERPNVDLLVAGTGDFGAELRAMAAGAANIRFLGRVDHSRLQRFYRQAVATLVPSLCYETFALVTAESFSVGTPLIVHARGSLAEIVGLNGGGIAYRDSEELGAAIDELRSDPTLRARLGREGRVAWEAEFAEDSFFTHYLGVVRELLAKKRSGKPLTAAEDARTPRRLAGRPLFVGGEP